MEKNYYEFKASSAEIATKQGLEQLGLTEETAEIEILSNGGIFSKALVRITPKEVQAAEAVAEPALAAEEEESVEKNSEERTPRPRSDRPRERREPVERQPSPFKLILEGMLTHMNLKSGVQEKRMEDEWCFHIVGEDSKNAIGHRGETLDAIQYLMSQIVNNDKVGDDRFRVTVDADFYRERRKRTLTALAKKLAMKAHDTKRELILEPMNSYERRIIHAALQGSEDATTRSEGEGRDRHIVIVPLNVDVNYGASLEFKKRGPGKTKSYGQKKRRF